MSDKSHNPWRLATLGILFQKTPKQNTRGNQCSLSALFLLIISLPSPTIARSLDLCLSVTLPPVSARQPHILSVQQYILLSPMIFFSVPLSFSFNTHSYSVNFTHHICPISNFEKHSYLTYSNMSAQTDQFILIFLI